MRGKRGGIVMVVGADIIELKRHYRNRIIKKKQMNYSRESGNDDEFMLLMLHTA
jgi:hypothetical protein